MPNKETVKIESVRRQKSPLAVILASLTIVVLLVCGFAMFRYWVSQVEYKDVQIGNRIFVLEVADTEAARERGLSERDSLGINKGMLFDFKKDGNWRMWMLKMRLNIDIAWVSSSGEIIYIKRNATPGSFPEAYQANRPSRYVIEVPARTFERLNIKVGDYIKIN
ncbi:DUF192 domain-containing protein [Candidatus Saccharibacteria bacterium]|nr:DUF192 domain-containing protein [Candidatus Saccharibacteria bacterium]HPW48092.1 DUF192 domain-containing protein [Candidatus Saccharibacteria bacterium]